MRKTLLLLLSGVVCLGLGTSVVGDEPVGGTHTLTGPVKVLWGHEMTLYGKDILIADKPAQFAEHVIDLIRDDNMRTELTANARKKIVEQYGWDVQAEKLDQIYRIVDRENKSKG